MGFEYWMKCIEKGAGARIGLLCLAGMLGACGSSKPKEVRFFGEEPFPKKLSAWNLFLKTREGLKPNARVVPYDLNTPLFSDYADKYRFVWMPPGASAQYRTEGTFEFPVGTVFAKSFAFPVNGPAREERLIETRLLVHARAGWIPLPYVWNAQQTEAMLRIAADHVNVQFTDAAGRKRDFAYHIPNTNECLQCHENAKVMLPIGPKARNLNKIFHYADGEMNQITYWTRAGYLLGAPSTESILRAAKWDERADGTLDERALAYLDSNCAHCHQPRGSAGYTGVDFRLEHFELAHAGECKKPNSAGYMGNLQYDIVPGRPDESILVRRMESMAPKAMMPQIGRAVVHEEGDALIREWIGAMKTEACGLVAQR